jgi:uncharacterized protein YejL (UPF0352 family)
LFDDAGKYAKSKDVDAFLAESAALLNEDQKLCVLLNLYDSLLSDGVAAPEEQALLNRFMTSYGVSEATLQPYALGISVKNNRKVLG